MIPIALPNANFFILLTAGFFAGLLLLIWGLVIAASAGARRTVRKYWKTSILLCLALAAPFSFYAWFQTLMWQIETEADRRQAALRVTLQEPSTVGGVAMPAGTRLTLRDEGQLDTYVEARFPQAVPILGVQASSARRYLDTRYEEGTYATLGRYPRTVILRGEGAQTVQGWRCDGAHDIEFSVQPDGALKAFEHCVLADGNAAAGLTIAAGAQLRGSDGTVYTDGSRDPDRWRVEVDSATAVKVFGLFLSRPTLYLDASRNVLRVTDAELACRTQFGGLTYAAGTQLKTARRAGGRDEPYPGVLVFTPGDGQTATRPGHDDVPEGMSVMQTLQGEVIKIVDNEAAGVFTFDTFIIDGKEPERPARARCP